MDKIDVLNRQDFIDILEPILRNKFSSGENYSIAIDGRWGSGKSFVLDLLVESLNKTQSIIPNSKPYLIIKYNAWEKDYYQEPLVALLSVILKSLKEKNIELKQNGKLSNAIVSISKVVGTIASVTLGFNFGDVVSAANDFRNDTTSLTLNDKSFNDNLPLDDALTKLKEALKLLSQDFNILIIVDELDRCLPEYAIKVLERLHHICNDLPLIQIIAIDKNVFAKSINTIFGEQNSSNGIPFIDLYLQKFVDITIPLSCGILNTKEDIFDGLDKGYTSLEYNDQYQVKEVLFDIDILHDFIENIMKDIDRRTQEKILDQVKLCHNLTLDMGMELLNNHYGILMYEILSCICYYYLKSTQKFHVTNPVANEISLVIPNKEIKPSPFLNNIYHFFYSVAEFYNEKNTPKAENYNDNIYLLKITDAKTFIMAYFLEDERIANDPYTGNYLKNTNREDFIFLRTFDNIIQKLNTKSDLN